MDEIKKNRSSGKTQGVAPLFLVEKHKEWHHTTVKEWHIACLKCLVYRQVAKLACRLFYYWTLLRNNNMATNLHVFTSRW